MDISILTQSEYMKHSSMGCMGSEFLLRSACVWQQRVACIDCFETGAEVMPSAAHARVGQVYALIAVGWYFTGCGLGQVFCGA